MAPMRWLGIAGLLSVAACGSSGPAEVEADPTVTGTWAGTLQGSLTMTLTLTQNADNSVTGSGSLSPRVNLDETIRVLSGTHDFTQLTLEIDPLPTCAFCPITRWTYVATLSDDLLTGTLNGGALVDESLILTR